MKYRKRPVVVEALRFTDSESAQKIRDAFGDDVRFGLGCLVIETLEGDMQATPGDWIIRGVAGEIYPCRDDIFRATYEPAHEAAALDARLRQATEDAQAGETHDLGTFSQHLEDLA